MEQAPFSTFEAEVEAARSGVTRRAFDPRTKPIYVGLALGWAALLVAMPLVHLSVDPVLTAAFLLVCGLVAWVAACLRLRGFARTAAGIEAWALLSAASLTGILGTYVTARLAAPFADTWMVAADRLIVPGIDWPANMRGLGRQPLAMHWANRAYASIQWQGSLLILLCCLTGHADRCAAFVLRWMIALALVCGIFALLPCLGPYSYFHIAHSEVPSVGSNIGWHQPHLLTWLRMTGPIRLDPSALDGIVEFPSFHTVAAVLFAWGFWPIRWARWPMLALNLAMIAASIPIGGHYFIDVLAGAVIAWISIKLPRWSTGLRSVRHFIAKLDATPRLA